MTEFSDCRIHNSDFYQTYLTNSNFTCSDLKGSIFENTNLENANFQNAKNYSINPLNNKIEKAKFSMPEVVSLLNHLGIRIEY
ncbi:MAG TPA: hypothetical protein ENL20_02610 [Candidatus Cloacimonetes bacterium]|nr:hypothetical protein [Candidatus Cloacimonadota bacterium]